MTERAHIDGSARARTDGNGSARLNGTGELPGARSTTYPRGPEPPAGGEDGRARSPMLEISTAIVRLYKEAFGRGPTKARANFAGPDCLIVLLEDSMTVPERTLAALGEHERLRESRLFFQHALEVEFRAIVERTLQRRTVAFVSGMDTIRDVSVELFTFEPQPQAPEPGAPDQG